MVQGILGELPPDALFLIRTMFLRKLDSSEVSEKKLIRSKEAVPYYFRKWEAKVEEE